VIAGIAVVGLIVFGAYLAYKYVVSADTASTGCDITATITKQNKNTHPIYVLNEANYKLAKSGAKTVNHLFYIDNGDPAKYVSLGTKVYFMVHDDDGGAPYIDPSPLICNLKKTVKVSANILYSSATISHTEERITSYVSGQAYCITDSTPRAGWQATYKYSNGIFTKQSGDNLAPDTISEELLPPADETKYGITTGTCEADSPPTGKVTDGSGSAAATTSKNCREGTQCVKDITSRGAETSAAYCQTTSEFSSSAQKIVDDSECPSIETTGTQGNQATTSGAAIGDKECLEETPGGQPILCTKATSTTYDDEGQWTCTDNKRRIDSEIQKLKIGIGSCMTLLGTPGQGSQETTGSVPKAIDQTGIDKNKNEVLVPVVGLGLESKLDEFKNKIVFTAYRRSEIEENGIVPVGGVTFSGVNQIFKDTKTTYDELKNKSTPIGNVTLANSLKCSGWNSLIGRLANFMRSKNFKFVTPDQGPTSPSSTLHNVQPALYQVTASKPGFESTQVCFQIAENDGVGQAVPINVLLHPSSGAEPPGITGKSTEVTIDETTGGRQQYRATIKNNVYKYLPDFPWYGWQRDMSGDQYKTSEPKDQDGNISVSSQPSNTLSGGSTTNALNLALSGCQDIETKASNVSSVASGKAAAVVGAVDSAKSSNSLSKLFGNTTMGAEVGLTLSDLTKKAATNVSIDAGKINVNCKDVLKSATSGSTASALTTVMLWAGL